MSATATQPVASASGRTPTRLASEYAKLAFGYDQAGGLIQVVGLQSGKNTGAPAVASIQQPGGGWSPVHVPLTGGSIPSFLTDLVVSTGNTVTEVVGLDNHGYPYLVGAQDADGAWTPGPGRLPGAPALAGGSLSAQTVNTSAIFALTRQGLPCVALYRDQQSPSRWQAGYPLPLPAGFSGSLLWLGARPEFTERGATHAIGLTAAGQACEIAVASGPGTGPGLWRAGGGLLGSGNLPVFTQLLLVSSDAIGNFHVIGLGRDGSVWDIDQYSARSAAPAWSGRSVRIAPGSPAIGARIGYYTTTSAVNPADFLLNLVAWGGAAPTVFAQYGITWSAAHIPIPTAGFTDRWYLVNDLVSPNVHLIGLSLVGHVHTIADCVNGIWSAGNQAPING